MKIQTNNTYYLNKQKNPTSFGTKMSKTVIEGRIVLHETCFFRNDFHWEKFIDTIIKKFPDGVKIHCHACSDGSEAYSIALYLIKKLGFENAEKYFPIQAKDLSDDLITKGRRGIVGIAEYFEIDRIKEKLGKNLKFEDYFHPERFSKYPEEFYNGIKCSQFKVSDKLRAAIYFEQEDLTKLSSNKEEKPIVFIARNFARYLNEDELKKLAGQLFNKLPEKSLLITGTLEKTFGFNKLLSKAGFKQIKNYNYTEHFIGGYCCKHTSKIYEKSINNENQNPLMNIIKTLKIH